jgi:general secretion pathway protein G
MKNKRNVGFTLIELLVVLAILALLAGLVGSQVIGYLGRAKSDTARLQVEQLSQSLDLFMIDVGRYPTNEEGLESLVKAPKNINNWHGPYLKKGTVPKDPWGRDYVYRSPGEHGAYDLYSLGADGSEGGDGENADITNWHDVGSKE